MHSHSRALWLLATNRAHFQAPAHSEVATRTSPWVRKPVCSVKAQPSTSGQSFSTFSTATSTPRLVDSLHLLAPHLHQRAAPSPVEGHAADLLPVGSELLPIRAGREPYNLA